MEGLKQIYLANQAKARLLILAALALLCVYFLFLIVRALVFPAPVVHAEISLTRQASVNARWNWFTANQPTNAVAEKTDEDLSESRLNAELLGVVIAGEDSVATIAVSRRDAEVFRIDDEIDRNVFLEEVEPNRVIVTQNGVRQQITLKDITGNKKRDSKEQSLIKVNQAPVNQSAGSFSLPGVGSTAPIQVPGVGMGLRLSQVSDEIGDLSDIQEGDVVIDINGTPVSELFSNPLIWQQFSQDTNLPMTVLRDGDQQQIFVNAASLFERIIPQIGSGLVQ